MSFVVRPFLKKLLAILVALTAYGQVHSQVCSVTCTPVVTDNIGITNVSLNTLNNTSPSLQCAVDYTALPATQLIAGESYLMQTTIGLQPSPAVITAQELIIYVDWDADGTFIGIGETMRFVSGLGPQATDAFIFTVPPGTPNGTYPMRVMSTGTGFLAGPCNITGGDAEDYSIQVVSPFPMTWLSMDASQLNNTCVQAGNQGVKMLLLEIETTGNTSPLTSTQFNFNTTGTSNPADITNADLHYLGINPQTALGNVYGSQTNPSGAFSISGTQTLSVGKNYFALTYDVAPGAATSNTLDAQFTDMIYSAPTTTVTPTTSAPPGNEIISAPVPLPYTRRASRWYFGNHVGLNFNCTPSPAILDDGITQTMGCTSLEGTATMCDTNGNLLFYAYEGNLVNKYHGITPNGTGLKGTCSSTQAYLPVPHPTNSDQYYLFTIEASGAATPGLYYSIVDMTLDGGKGDIVGTLKNVLVNDTVTERLSAVHHCNDQDIWIITHDGNYYYSYLLTNAGLQPAVISPIPNSPSTSAGQMMVSPTGMHIGEVQLGQTHFYSFDDETGEVCWLESSSTYGGYGCSFSNDGSKFYSGEFFQGLQQYNMAASPIVPSRIPIYTVLGSNYGHMHLAPDGKLYWFNATDTLGSVINDPNSLGLLCDYLHDTIPLKHSAATSSTYGAINYIQSWFLDSNYIEPGISADFGYNDTCFPAPVQFYDNSTYNVECPRFLWDFDDPSTGANNSSTLQNPVHTFSAYGTYQVKLIIKERCKIDSIIIPVVFSGLSAGLNSTLDICDDMGPFDLVDFIAGNPDPSGIISPALNSGTSIFDPALDVAGTYTYTHTDSCANSSNTTINLINCEVCTANLVPNPSFESISSCPSVGGQMTAVDDWDNYTGVTGGGSADYFNSCGYSNPSVQANTGNGHIGFFSYIDFIPDAREYAQAQLASPLVAGECYSISMYLALSSSSDYAHDSVGILLTAAPPIGSVGGVIYATPQLATTTSNMVTDSNWVLISGTFVASGGEQFITIGVFTDDANLTLVPTGIMPDPTIIDHSYYMVDDVCVHAATPDTPSIFTPNSWYCVGDNITALTSDIGNAWYDDALLTNQVGIDTSFTPTPVAGTTTYYVIDTTGGCYSLADSVNVTFENCSDPCSTNLFQNGGFESYSACPTGPSEITNATGWLNVQSASNDYFNCTYLGHPSGTTYPGFPNATDGMFYNPEGSGYVGFIAGGTGFGKEGFGQQIDLKKCVEYTIQFRMAHNNVSGPPDNDICIYGGNAPTALGCMTGFTSLACIEADSIALNWKLFTLTFTPTQDYSYLAISGACPTTGTSAIGGYVYLDDLFLCEDLCANQATNITPIVISDDFCGTGIGSATVSLITPCFTGFSFDWTLGGISVSTDSISTGLQAGTYDVLVTDSNSCTISTNVVIPDSGSISAPTVSNDTAYCANDTLANLLAQGSGGTINWYSDNNLTAVIGTGDSLSPSISIGTTTYYLNETFMGCTSPIDSVVVSITPAPNVTIVGDTSFCTGDSIILDAGNSGSAYSWLPGGETSQTVFISYSGLQLVIVTDTNGCSNSDSVMVVEASLPIHNGISGSNICLGHLATLISSGLGSLSWSTTETSDSIFVSPATSTTFYSTYTNSCGSITDSIVVTVHPNPSTNAYGDTTVAPLENTTIGASGGVSYSWSPAAGLDCSSCADPVASITQTTLFFVVVTDSNGCSDIDSVLVTIDDNTALFVPNVFSPNGDGFNDEVFVRGGAFSEFHFTIYNRWGQVVFETKDRLVGWNGTYKNKELDPAVFVYRLAYTDWQGTEGELSGNITLIK